MSLAERCTDPAFRECLNCGWSHFEPWPSVTIDVWHPDNRKDALIGCWSSDLFCPVCQRVFAILLDENGNPELRELIKFRR